MKYKATTLILLALIILIFLAYFITPLFIKEENSENRTMATFDMVFNPDVNSVVYRESPVERLDAALSDQIPFREELVRIYLGIFNASENVLSGLFFRKGENQYSFSSIGNYILIDNTDYIAAYPSAKKFSDELLQKHKEQIERLHRIFPSMQIYVYYVTKADETTWFDAFLGVQTPDHYEQIREILPDYVKSDHLVYQNLDDYMNIHYKTDHHWNHKGARRGYEQIYSMMSENNDLGEMLIPESENLVSQTYSFTYKGSYGRSLGDLYKGDADAFSFYEYNFPDRYCSILSPETMEETEVVSMGLYEKYREGDISKREKTDHYITFYGSAVDQNNKVYKDSAYVFIIRNTKGNGRNLLICGDSYSRAMRDPLASHFGTTVYLDYRLLASVPIDDLIERYDINVLLISSNTSLWNSQEYFFTFKEQE